jgi:hypothetical protein
VQISDDALALADGLLSQEAGSYLDAILSLSIITRRIVGNLCNYRPLQLQGQDVVALTGKLLVEYGNIFISDTGAFGGGVTQISDYPSMTRACHLFLMMR